MDVGGDVRCYLIGFGVGVLFSLLTLLASYAALRLWRWREQNMHKHQAIVDIPLDPVHSLFDGLTTEQQGGFDAFGDEARYDPEASINPETFQTLWSSSIVIDEDDFVLSSEEGLRTLVDEHAIHCIASGDSDGVHKYFFYAQEERDATRVHLAELRVEPTSLQCHLTVRGQRQFAPNARTFTDYFMTALSALITHQVDV